MQSVQSARAIRSAMGTEYDIIRNIERGKAEREREREKGRERKEAEETDAKK